MHLNTIPGMMIRHEVVCQLERNVKIFQGQRCYMCDVESVVCQDEIGGRMRELIWPMHLNAISGKCWCDVVCQDDST